MRKSALQTGMIMMALGAGTGTVGYREVADIADLKRNGERAISTIVDIDQFTGHKASDRPTYSPIVEWETPGGERVRVDAPFGSPTKSSYRIGATLPVYYDPRQPRERFYIDRPDKSAGVWFMDRLGLIIGAIFFLPGAFIALRAIRESRRKNKLFR